MIVGMRYLFFPFIILLGLSNYTRGDASHHDIRKLLDSCDNHPLFLCFSNIIACANPVNALLSTWESERSSFKSSSCDWPIILSRLVSAGYGNTAASCSLHAALSSRNLEAFLLLLHSSDSPVEEACLLSQSSASGGSTILHLIAQSPSTGLARLFFRSGYFDEEDIGDSSKKGSEPPPSSSSPRPALLAMLAKNYSLRLTDPRINEEAETAAGKVEETTPFSYWVKNRRVLTKAFLDSSADGGDIDLHVIDAIDRALLQFRGKTPLLALPAPPFFYLKNDAGLTALEIACRDRRGGHVMDWLIGRMMQLPSLAAEGGPGSDVGENSSRFGGSKARLSAVDAGSGRFFGVTLESCQQFLIAAEGKEEEEDVSSINLPTVSVDSDGSTDSSSAASSVPMRRDATSLPPSFSPERHAEKGWSLGRKEVSGGGGYHYPFRIILDKISAAHQIYSSSVANNSSSNSSHINKSSSITPPLPSSPSQTPPHLFSPIDILTPQLLAKKRTRDAYLVYGRPFLLTPASSSSVSGDASRSAGLVELSREQLEMRWGHLVVRHASRPYEEEYTSTSDMRLHPKKDTSESGQTAVKNIVTDRVREGNTSASSSLDYSTLSNFLQSHMKVGGDATLPSAAAIFFSTSAAATAVDTDSSPKLKSQRAGKEASASVGRRRRGDGGSPPSPPPYVFDADALKTENGTSLSLPFFRLYRTLLASSQKRADSAATSTSGSGIPVPLPSVRPPLEQLIIGSLYTGAPPHFHPPAINICLTGLKLWWLTPPRDAFFFDGTALDWWSQKLEEWAVDPSTRTPQGEQTLFLQGPGEVVYIPRFWGHAVLNLADSVSIAFEAP